MKGYFVFSNFSRVEFDPLYNSLFNMFEEENMKKIIVKNVEINITGIQDYDYWSLSDIAKIIDPDEPRFLIRDWMKSKETIEFLGLWEILNNDSFKRVEFDTFRNDAGSNRFTITPTKWIQKTNAIGIKTSRGRYSEGTFAHRDIALEFASWISPEIKLYIVKEFQRLKIQESNQLDWENKRLMTKLNYLIQTEAVKKHLIKVELTENQKNFIYANEADLLNVALFGLTSSEWKNKNPDKNGLIRDYASTIELNILSNLEFYNAKMITNHIPQHERLEILNEEANKEKDLFNRNNYETRKIKENKTN